MSEVDLDSFYRKLDVEGGMGRSESPGLMLLDKSSREALGIDDDAYYIALGKWLEKHHTPTGP